MSPFKAHGCIWSPYDPSGHISFQFMLKIEYCTVSFLSRALAIESIESKGIERMRIRQRPRSVMGALTQPSQGAVKLGCPFRVWVVIRKLGSAYTFCVLTPSLAMSYLGRGHMLRLHGNSQRGLRAAGSRYLPFLKKEGRSFAFLQLHLRSQFIPLCSWIRFPYYHFPC